MRAIPPWICVIISGMKILTRGLVATFFLIVTLLALGGGAYWYAQTLNIPQPVSTTANVSLPPPTFVPVFATDSTSVSASTTKLSMTASNGKTSVIELIASDPNPSLGCARGNNVTLIAVVKDVPKNGISLFSVDGNLFETKDTAPYKWEIKIPADSTARMKFVAVADINGILATSSVVTITPQVDWEGFHENTKYSTAITFASPSPKTLFVGDNEQLDVMGFVCGLYLNITESRFGTTYSKVAVNGEIPTTSDSKALCISPDGKVVALSTGVVDIKATNRGNSNWIRFHIENVPEELGGVNPTVDLSQCSKTGSD